VAITHILDGQKKSRRKNGKESKSGECARSRSGFRGPTQEAVLLRGLHASGGGSAQEKKKKTVARHRQTEDLRAISCKKMLRLKGRNCFRKVPCGLLKSQGGEGVLGHTKKGNAVIGRGTRHGKDSRRSPEVYSSRT